MNFSDSQNSITALDYLVKKYEHDILTQKNKSIITKPTISIPNVSSSTETKFNNLRDQSLISSTCTNDIPCSYRGNQEQTPEAQNQKQISSIHIQNPKKIYSLAKTYRKGKSVEKDIMKAKELYFEAAELGYVRAFHALLDINYLTKEDCLRLGEIYKDLKNDLGSEKNMDMFGEDALSSLINLYEQHNILPKIAKLFIEMNMKDEFHRIIYQVLIDSKCSYYDIIDLIYNPKFDKMFDDQVPKIIMMLRRSYRKY